MEQGAYSHIVIRNILDKYAYLSKQERAFFTRLTEGTIERCIELDYYLNQVSKTKVHKMKPQIRTILRLGTYQLKYMDSVPPAAACNEAVKLAKKKGFSSLSGFVNGVLRNLSRQLDDIALPKEDNKALSLQYSMPLWLVEHFVRSYGLDRAKECFECFLAESPTSIRINTLKCSREDLIHLLEEKGYKLGINPDIKEGAYLLSYDSLSRIEEFRKGYFSVQDYSSMMVGQWLDAKSGQNILDVCAAPGGKAFHAYERMKGEGQVIARDLTEEKTALIKENANRLGEEIQIEVHDARKADPALHQWADAVLCDLPCSGLGIIGKKTDIKYKTSQEQLDELSKLQRQILSVVRDYVKPDGRLLYSTCTLNPGENEENVNWFLKEFPEFELVKMQDIFPVQGKNDGFFLALLKKKGE